jgi:ABC-type lipoprotein export system ATPase subunit
MKFMLELIDVTKGYGSPGLPGYVAVLNSINLKLKAMDAVAVLGPSGCGKTTLLNIIGALDKPSSGQVKFMGRISLPLMNLPLPVSGTRRSGLYLRCNLLPHCTVLENVLVPTLAYPDRAKSSSLKERAVSLIERMGSVTV